MTDSNEISGNRWYDRDPALKRAMAQLREAPDHYQAQIALNIIKIIVEHQMEEETQTPSDALARSLSMQNGEVHRKHRRWYDMNETLASAIQLLSESPADLKERIIPSIAHMIDKTLESEAS